MKIEKKTKAIILLFLGVIALFTSIFIFTVVLVIYNLPDMSAQYGLVNISVNGKQLYFKREARGLNYDSLILSANDNHCADYDPDSDYRFITSDPTVYYKIEGDILHLTASNTAAPKNFPVKVNVHQIVEPGEWFALKERHKERGLEFLEIPLVDSLKCN